ncbi:MAG: hypothetical protein IJ489_03685 [Clostridia bacterium]|nr:hypothetical protein [Clostridia bacterium]
MIFKFAIRNLIRLPWRTLLYIAVTFGIVLSITASLFVYRACENTISELDERYVFVASVVPKGRDSVLLSGISACLKNTDVLAYNITVAEASGAIPSGRNMTKMPSLDDREEAEMLWLDDEGMPFLAVENLSLVPSFFDGRCTIREGTGITASGYSGEESEIVIPWWLAQKYGISVGDTLTKRYEYGKYTFFEAKVVGIYEANVHTFAEKDYPAYIPLAIAEMDLGYTIVRYMHETIAVQRADFVLNGRNAFEEFVLTAKENGFNFQKAKIVFNNSAYDSLSSEIANIHMIALLVCIVILIVGLGILIFFTIYLCHTRTKERILLISWGMTKRKVNSMLVIELLIMLIISICLGVFGGYFAADGICSYVNESVLSRAEASDAIQNEEINRNEPLFQNTSLEISVSSKKEQSESIAVNYNLKADENEIGVSKHTYQFVGTELAGMENREWIPVSVVGVTDLGEMNVSVHFETFQQNPNYRDFFLYGYVSENSPYAPKENELYTTYYINGCARDAFVRIDGQNIESAESLSQTKIYIIGTYKDTEYCSESDILLRMDDYHRLYSEHSVTTDTFYFERIGAVYTKEEK